MQSKILLTIVTFTIGSYISGAEQTSDYEYGKEKKTKFKQTKPYKKPITEEDLKKEKAKNRQKLYRTKQKKEIADLKASLQVLTAEKEKHLKLIEDLKAKQNLIDLENSQLQQKVTLITEQRDSITDQYWAFWKKYQAAEFANNVFANVPQSVSYKESGSAQSGDALVSYQVQGVITSS